MTNRDEYNKEYYRLNKTTMNKNSLSYYYCGGLNRARQRNGTIDFRKEIICCSICDKSISDRSPTAKYCLSCYKELSKVRKKEHNQRTRLLRKKGIAENHRCKESI